MGTTALILEMIEDKALPADLDVGGGAERQRRAQRGHHLDELRADEQHRGADERDEELGPHLRRQAADPADKGVVAGAGGHGLRE